MFLELFSLATFRNWLDNEIGILIFVSEEVIEDGDSMIFSWSDTVAKIKYQSKGSGQTLWPKRPWPKRRWVTQK